MRLAGGGINEVVKIEDTVRRPARKWTSGFDERREELARFLA